MSCRKARWRVVLAPRASDDFLDIIRWTEQSLGRRQAVRYAAILRAAIRALADGPSTPGARPRPEIGQGLMTLHASKGRRAARHFLLFRVTPDASKQTVEVVRILHDAMDLPRHVDRP